MSYILEALKKSQQEREVGLVPEALTDTPPATGSRAALGRHAWGYFSLVLAVVAILISLYGLVQGRFSEPSGASEAAPNEASVAPADVDRSPSAPDLQSAPAPDVATSRDQVPETGLAGAGSGPPTSTDSEAALAQGAASEHAVPPQADAGAEVLAAPGVARGGAGGAVVVTSEAPLPAAPEGASGPRPSVRRTPEPAPERSEVAAFQPAPEDSKPATFSRTKDAAPALTDGLEKRVAELAVAAERKIAVSSAPLAVAKSGSDRAPVRPPRKLPPGPGQLPPAVFKTLPEARVLVHVYVDQPAQRFVILNSRKLREGDTSPEGLGMEEILPEGVVLSFKGHRFFIPR